MRRFRAFNVYLLALVILLGSVLNVHSHFDQLGNEVTETSKTVEGEDVSQKSRDFFAKLNHILNQFDPHAFSQIAFFDHDFHSQSYFTITHLLDSHRIALPPPYVS